ncbi:GyrI-like domain-containing protein [Sulfurospirillum sp. hDNRA2]|uniref:AraC family transcriptional regulator n=1 Tax=Sulfurospirillum sp. hDNRA2 TaxID=3237298 RepID=UPI0020B757F1|nr:AraC family transcriptional regulator [Sulfurospirillum sp. DNRA8]MCP3650715.1 AraC family transcriptional regulator [Sulfurospirillum sp. DNRA8]MCR1809560.1 AraC family transcriptional regulator [Sulfurospirillum sp. DNRA8]
MKHKRTTQNDHIERINETLYAIHADLSQNLSVETLAGNVAMSVFHFNRIFKEVVGESVHAYAKRVKLEHAANVLLFTPEATITHIMREVGFHSNASFTQAFKENFGVTPSKWREVDQINAHRDLSFSGKSLHVKVAAMPSFEVAYVRHKGYDKSIQTAWLKLQAWALQEGIAFNAQTMIALHHSNPRFVEASKCHYVACLELPKTRKFYRSGEIGVMKIPQTFCAIFSLQGVYGDLKKYMDVIYHEWFPKSDYEKVSLPSFAIYRQNHFIDPCERFDLDFCVPVRFK